ncbi:acyl-CoA desaturase [Telmatocola sphagniphila]|uniref:Acyl-CoA desaturase n=1 Tax=Telmatocola sphagniphila TaxID=1123043 RepID=A0A8E6B8W3_9BACT|nr:acyl-CoA desaturase [Telmatocola sphagniphila]QVL34048.1 acyl-CoA desaturase [Telmatocola sphagniphila]
MQTIRFETERNDFYKVLKQRVDEYFRQTGKSRFANGSTLVKGLVFGSLILASYTLILLHPFPLWTLLPLAFVFGVASLLMAINIGHDAAHQVLFKSRLGNEIVHGVSFALLGVSAYLWQMRHTKSHHIFPNVNGCDIDIDENPFIRLSPNQPWRKQFRFQHLYAPIAYIFVALYTIVYQDFAYLFKRRIANLTNITHPPYQYVVFGLCKAFYFVAILAVPIWILPLPWWQVVLGYLAMKAVASLVFVFLLIGTHFSAVTEFPAVAADGSVGHSWAIHNLVTACDWSPHSRIAHFFVGGVNAHASHHLFPRISHAHYRAIARIIEDTAKEFDVRYNHLTLPGIVYSHFQFLRKMGRRPAGVESRW